MSKFYLVFQEFSCGKNILSWLALDNIFRIPAKPHFYHCFQVGYQKFILSCGSFYKVWLEVFLCFFYMTLICFSKCKKVGLIGVKHFLYFCFILLNLCILGECYTVFAFRNLWKALFIILFVIYISVVQIMLYPKMIKGCQIWCEICPWVLFFICFQHHSLQMFLEFMRAWLDAYLNELFPRRGI